MEGGVRGVLCEECVSSQDINCVVCACVSMLMCVLLYMVLVYTVCVLA